MEDLFVSLHGARHNLTKFIDCSLGNSNNPGSYVSPENSEDGYHPLLGDGSNQAAKVNPSRFPVASQFGANTVLQQPTSTAIGFPVLPNPVLSGQTGYSTEISKRMCVEGNNGAIFAVAAGQAPSFVSGLANAAAQAMLQQPTRGRKKKSQDQIDRRRERNRVLAKRTRLRKKFFFESLQKEIMDLQRDNHNLKVIVRENLDDSIAKQILDQCNAVEKMPPSVLEACSEGFGDLDSQDFNLVTSIQKSQHAFVITDPSLEDNPIVFASDDFLKLTGYDRSEVLGRNCRFLQGDKTSKAKIAMIRNGLAKDEDVSVTFINYKKDGTSFWNKLFIAALRDAQNNIVNYIGVTVIVASPPPGDPEHGVSLPEEDTSSDTETASVDINARANEGSI